MMEIRRFVALFYLKHFAVGVSTRYTRVCLVLGQLANSSLFHPSIGDVPGSTNAHVTLSGLITFFWAASYSLPVGCALLLDDIINKID